MSTENRTTSECFVGPQTGIVGLPEEAWGSEKLVAVRPSGSVRVWQRWATLATSASVRLTNDIIAVYHRLRRTEPDVRIPGWALAKMVWVIIGYTHKITAK